MKTQNLRVTGKLRTKVYENGQLVSDHTGDNMIVNLGLTAISKLIGGDDPATGKPVAKGSVGVSATAPAATDNAITTPFYKNVAAVSYPAVGQVRIDYAIETHESNGITINEYGLHNVDNILYARITKAPIVKTAAIRIECEWTIILTWVP